MNILSAKVEWFHDYGNNPALYITVDEKFKFDGCVWKKVPIGHGNLYVSKTQKPYVRFLLEDPYNQNGFGGSKYNLRMDTGDEVTIKGPWSSRAGVVNEYGQGPCMDVAINDGSGWIGTAVTLEFALRAIELVDDCYLIAKCGETTRPWYEWFSFVGKEFAFYPSRSPDRITK